MRRAPLHRLFARRRRAVALLATLGALAIAPACGRSAPDADAGAPTPVTQTFEGGPLTVSVTLDKPAITVAERLRVRIDAAVASGYAPAPLEIGDSLGGFTVIERSAPPPHLGGRGATVTTLELVLEPFLPGDYEIPPVEVHAAPVGEGSDEAPIVLSTAPITVPVASVLAPGDAPAEIAGLKGVADPPPAGRVWLVGAVLALGALLAAAAVLARVWARRVSTPAPPVSADEAALARLNALLARALVEGGEIKLFYNEISDILRRYIEDRFAIRAPERTTEEFLRELGVGGPIDPADVPTLREFLSHCDLVKFAEYAPTTDQIDHTVRVVRTFIDRTRTPAPAPGAPPAGAPPPVAPPPRRTVSAHAT